MMAVKIAYRKPHAVEINRIASRRLKPTVVGFTCSHRKYRNTSADTMAVQTAKRRIGFSIGCFTRETLVYSIYSGRLRIIQNMPKTPEQWLQEAGPQKK